MSSAVASPRPTLVQSWLRGWRHIAFLVLSLLTGTFAVGIAVCILVGSVLVVAAGSGLLLLAPALWLAWWFAREELARIEAFTDRRITPQPAAHSTGWRVTLGFTRAHWQAAAYSALHVLWGLFSGVLVSGALSGSLAVLAMPLYLDRMPTEGTLRLFSLFSLDSTQARVTIWILALAVLAVLPLAARHLTWVDATIARLTLGEDPEAEIAQLSERVETLTASRTETVDSVESERRRIERDLHDGPQQRLVAIAMDLGMARERLAHDPEGARELLDKAHLASKEAIVEMRHVARGITPPILADRGLDAAVSALAVRSPVPVTVEAGAVGRLDPTTEAIGYYCVSELLTNVAKHSQARQATVRLDLHQHLVPPALVIAVEDDGVGGADPRGGTGLVGLRQRVSSVDGTIAVRSPAGGPTAVLIHLPARQDPGGAPPNPPRTATSMSDPRHGIPTPKTTPDPTPEETP